MRVGALWRALSGCIISEPVVRYVNLYGALLVPPDLARALLRDHDQPTGPAMGIIGTGPSRTTTGPATERTAGHRGRHLGGRVAFCMHAVTRHTAEPPCAGCCHRPQATRALDWSTAMSNSSQLYGYAAPSDLYRLQVTADIIGDQLWPRSTPRTRIHSMS